MNNFVSEQRENNLILLRCIAKREEFILRSPSGNLASYQIREWKEMQHYTTEPVEKILQLEIYGEYPLSPANQFDYDNNVKAAFNLNTH
jgi:hypothetical protein